MSLFGAIGDFLGSSTGKFLGDIVGGGLSFLGQSQAAQAGLEAAQIQADAARQAATAATAEAIPYTIGSLGGIAEFNANKRAGYLGLSPELSNIYAGALARSGMFGAQGYQYAALDPFAAGELFYQQSQPYYQQEEDRARTALETRLLAQGRLGSTGGALEQQALQEAIGRGQMERRDVGFTKAQALVDALIGRERGDIGQAIGLLNVPLQQAAVGRGIGGTLASTAAAGLTSQAESQKLLAQVRSQNPGMFSTALQGIGGYVSKNYGT